MTEWTLWDVAAISFALAALIEAFFNHTDIAAMLLAIMAVFMLNGHIRTEQKKEKASA